MLFSEIERLLRLLVAQGQENETLMRIQTALAQENNTLTLALLNETRHINRRVRDIEQDIDRILVLLTPDIEDFSLTQGDIPMAITGVTAGTSASFTISFVPPNGVPLQSGPTATSDDPLAVLSAVDPATNKFTATVDASDTAATFNVTVAGVNGAGASISHVFNIPILPPAPVQITDFGLDQDQV